MMNDEAHEEPTAFIDVGELCRRITANDATLTEVNAERYSYIDIDKLIESLEANYNRGHRLYVTSIRFCYWQVLSVEKLLAVLLHFSRPPVSISEAEPRPASPLKSLSLDGPHIHAFDIQAATRLIGDFFESLFGGMARELAGLENVCLVTGVLTERSAVALREALSSPYSKLESLRLNTFEITEDMVHFLVSGIQSNHGCFKDLDLSANEIGDAGAQQLAVLLSRNNNNNACALRRLQLANNRIGDTGATALATALQDGNDTLTYLGLAMNEIGDLGTMALVNAIVGHPTLEHWDMAHNYFDIKGQQAVIGSVPHFRFLKTLQLGPIEPPNEGEEESFEEGEPLKHDSHTVMMLQHFAVGMPQNHSLEHLMLEWICASDYENDDDDDDDDVDDSVEQSRTHQLWNAYHNQGGPQSRFLSSTSIATLFDKQHYGTPTSEEDRSVLETIVFIHFFMNMNRLGFRQDLFNQNLSLGLRPLILERVSRIPSLVFYLLQEQPNLFIQVQRRLRRSPRKRSRSLKYGFGG